MILNEVSREVAALVAIVSIAMVAICVNILPHCWHRFEDRFRTLSLSVRKSTSRFVPWLCLPILLLFVYAWLSERRPDYMPGMFILVLGGTALLVFLIEIGVAIKRKIKKQIAVKAEPYTLAYLTALYYMLISVLLNVFALIGVSPTMLLIDIGPFGPENFAWGRWFLYIGIYAFIVGITLFGATYAIDRAGQRNNKFPEEGQK